jgi:hypothetical protein
MLERTEVKPGGMLKEETFQKLAYHQQLSLML